MALGVSPSLSSHQKVSEPSPEAGSPIHTAPSDSDILQATNMDIDSASAEDPGDEEATPYNADDAALVKALMDRLRVSQAQLVQGHSVSGSYLSWWLRGENTHRPGILRAGEVAMQWYEANKDNPSPPEGVASVPYSEEDASKVKILIDRLRISQTQIAQESVVKLSYLSWWLRGENTHRPGVARAGEAALQWFEINKDRPSPPAQVRDFLLVP